MIDSFRGKYAFLSNFYSSPITIHAIVYPTVEHAFHAMKSLDQQTREIISKAPTATTAKHMGNEIKLRSDWEDIKLSIMKALVFFKFSAHIDLQARLLETGDEKLVEGNWWRDTFWGVCNGKGENHLGKILMEVRDIFRGEKNGQICDDNQ